MKYYANKLPIIIPAYNESGMISQTLRRLPAKLVEPLVVINASTDSTFYEAETCGARTYVLEKQGKLPAIQAGLRILGEKALGPLVLLDADTIPIFPKFWALSWHGLLTKDKDDSPIVGGGPIIFADVKSVDNSIKTIRRLGRAYRNKSWSPEKRMAQAGPQQGLNIKNKQVLEQILELPNIWPGEDGAIMSQIGSNGGRVYQPLSIGMLATTPTPQAYLSEWERYKVGKEEARRRVQDVYKQRGV